MNFKEKKRIFSLIYFLLILLAFATYLIVQNLISNILSMLIILLIIIFEKNKREIEFYYENELEYPEDHFWKKFEKIFGFDKLKGIAVERIKKFEEKRKNVNESCKFFDCYEYHNKNKYGEFGILCKKNGLISIDFCINCKILDKYKKKVINENGK